MGVRLPAVVGCLLAAASAHAFVPKHGPAIVADTLTALPAAGTKPLRTHRALSSQATPPIAWQKFAAVAGANWQATWDDATGVPSQMWGPGIPVPGANASPVIAAAFATQMLADHIALLAPGTVASDFHLVSNSSDGAIRSIGFVQHVGGTLVVGGQLSFRFKRDRLYVIASQALPNIAAKLPITPFVARASAARAVQSVRAAVNLPLAPVTALGDDVVLPLVGDVAVLGYRVVTPYQIDGGRDGRFVAYTDPSSAAVIAVRQLNDYVTGDVLYHTVDRYPGRGYKDNPAPQCFVQLDGTTETTAQDGSVSWSSGTETVTTSASGNLVAMVNKAADGTAATTQLMLAPNGSVVWDASAVEEDNAQLSAFIDVNNVKEYIRANIDPAMPNLEAALTVNVNLDMDCNAFFDGTALNFFHATTDCENTALVQDVGYHEFGHDLHYSEIIAGVGAFDGAMSEGAADYLAASVTGDSGVGRGFYYTDAPLREIDPVGMEYQWPFDIGEIHHTGLIFSGAFWDLRKALIAQYGTVFGVALVDELYVGALRRSVDIPSSFIETLAADDDDGDLSNGTPHECQIRKAFGAHGLRDAAGHVEAPATLDEAAQSIGVIIDVTGLSARCPSDQASGATFSWSPDFFLPEPGMVDASLAGLGRFFAQLPLALDDTVFYSARIKFSDGSQLELPDNRADSDYQLYQGHTIPLYCTDFESEDPLANGWTTGAVDPTGTIASPWTWGTPTSGASNPHAAFSGNHALVQDLNTDYPPSSFSYVATPPIDVGQYTDVRLQYRRWLAVEDGNFDQARITANGNRAWFNYDSQMGGSSTDDLIDKEWRFQDVPLTQYFSGHTLTVGWDLTANSGLQLAGWALDDVCIVANPKSICGDGIKTVYEQCDDGSGNADEPDQCRTYCKSPACGDGIVDTGEECDDGSATETCNEKCKITPTGGGCCSTSGGGAGSLLLGALVFGLLRRRGSKRRSLFSLR